MNDQLCDTGNSWNIEGGFIDCSICCFISASLISDPGIYAERDPWCIPCKGHAIDSFNNFAFMDVGAWGGAQPPTSHTCM